MLKELINHQDQKGTKCEFTVHDSPPQNGVSECGMCTHTKQAHALLIALGLPRFLWEEAIKHSAWLQEQTPAQALNGRTPYEMGHKKKPYLGGIQKFRAAAYVKDLAAGKLNAQAKKGCFIGYNLESKGYQIYWPKKQSIMVKRNVVFNQDDLNSHNNTAIIYGEALSEGDKEKVIQNSQNDVKVVKEPENNDSEDHLNQPKEPEAHQSPTSTNTVHFPMSDEPQNPSEPEPEDNSQSSNQQYGHGDTLIACIDMGACNPSNLLLINITEIMSIQLATIES